MASRQGSPSPAGSPALSMKGKVVVVGEYSVGKTSLTHRFIDKSYTGMTEPTIGAAFQVRTVNIPPQNTPVRLEIWDTAGSERYRSLMPMYYRDAVAAIICYDITNAKTFDRCTSWVDDFRKHNEISDDVLCVLAGTKLDLEGDRQVETEDAQMFAEKENMLFFETSARTDMNVVELFTQIATHIYNSQKDKFVPGNGGAGGTNDGRRGGNVGGHPQRGGRGGKVDLRDDFSYRKKRPGGEKKCKC